MRVYIIISRHRHQVVMIESLGAPSSSEGSRPGANNAFPSAEFAAVHKDYARFSTTRLREMIKSNEPI